MAKKKEVLEIFKSQLNELDALTYQESVPWKSYTTEIMKKYLGDDSRFFYGFKGAYSYLETRESFQGDKLVVNKLLLKCIEYIDKNGVYKQPTSNFISRISNEWAIAIVTIILPSIGYAIYNWGVWSAKTEWATEKTHFQYRIDSLKNKPLLPTIRPSNTPPDKKTKSINQPKKKE